MALISFTKGDSGVDYKTYTWAGATNGGSPDTFNPVKIDRTPYSIGIQASGTYSGSASIALHGSLDGTNFVALDDLDGTAIALTAVGIKMTRQAVLHVKPVMTGGDGSADIDLSIVIRFDDL